MAVKKASSQAKWRQHLHDNSVAHLTTTVFAIVVGLCLVLLLARSWVRVTVVPKTVSVFYGNSINKVSDTEFNKIKSSLSDLGLTNLTPNKACIRTTAKNFSEEVSCQYIVSSTLTIADGTSADTLTSKAQTLQKLLQDNGWSGTYTEQGDEVSFVKLVSNVANNVDYTPDAYYTKVVGELICTFDSNTAFKIPENPAKAFTSNFNCSRLINVFGGVPEAHQGGAVTADTPGEIDSKAE